MSLVVDLNADLGEGAGHDDELLALVTSAFGSYSGCRQYLQDICQAQAQVGEGAPRIDKIRSFFNHPDFIEQRNDATASGSGGSTAFW